MVKEAAAIANPRGDWKSETLSIKAFTAVLSYLALTAAVVLSAGFLDSGALLLLVIALGLAVAGTVLRWPDIVGRAARRFMPFVLCFVVGAELLSFCVIMVALYNYKGIPLAPFLLGSSLLILLVGTYAWGRLPWPRTRFFAILGVFFLLGAWHYKVVPVPTIDVWYFQQQGVRNLLEGENPYAAEYPNVFPDVSLYGPTMVKDGRVRSCPYPPLSLFLALPGYLLGDVRWSLLLAMIGTAALMAGTGRALGLQPGHFSELAPVAFLCHPLALFVLHGSWTEPFVALATSFCAWAMAAGRSRALLVGLAALISTKQYALLWVVLLWASGHLNWRKTVLAGTLAGLINLPFVLWDPAAFWRGIFAFHINSPFRADSLTVLAALKVWTGMEVSPVVGCLAAAITLLIVRRARPSITDAALGGAAVFLSFFLFNKAGHMNYYWFAGSLLPIAVIVSAGESCARDGRGDNTSCG
jgi:hypothetical protein